MPTKLKPSRYNCYAKTDKGMVVAHNLLRGTSVRFHGHIFPMLSWLFDDQSREIPCNIDPQVLARLADYGFLVDGDLDEVSLVRNRYQEAVAAKDNFGLVILPTLWCNFNCPYCFEYHTPVSMSDRVRDAIKIWIEKRFSEKKHFFVAWFGGEPLLEKNLIGNLSRFFVTLSQRHDALYSASITSNGFLLDDKFCHDLDALHIKRVQVTLDGHGMFHDRTRRQRNGRGTYKQIATNIERFHEIGSNATLIIRVNCTDTNINSIPTLLLAFRSRVRERTRIFFRWVWPNEASGNIDFAATARGNVPFERLSLLYETAAKAGWKIIDPVSATSPVYCECDCRDHYSISPSGDIFLCSHTYDAAERIGNVTRVLDGLDVIDDSFNSRVNQWFAVDGFRDQECIHCKLLPVCKGGCRKERVAGGRACVEQKGQIDRFILNRGSASGLI